MHLSEVEPRSRQRANFQSRARNDRHQRHNMLRGSELIIGLQGSADDGSA
jgi:flagellar basal body P-ring protein FlgI